MNTQTQEAQAMTNLESVGALLMATRSQLQAALQVCNAAMTLVAEQLKVEGSPTADAAGLTGDMVGMESPYPQTPRAPTPPQSTLSRERALSSLSREQRSAATFGDKSEGKSDELELKPPPTTES